MAQDENFGLGRISFKEGDNFTVPNPLRLPVPVKFTAKPLLHVLSGHRLYIDDNKNR